MSYATVHYFWQQRVDREINARNKFIESNIIGKMNDMDNSYHLYEIGLSDPNQIKPREFKQNYRNIPVNLSGNIHQQLSAMTTQQTDNVYENIYKKNSQKTEYIGYNNMYRNNNIKRANSQISNRRMSYQQYMNQDKIIDDGRKVRQRFNEQIHETLSRKSGISQENIHKNRNHFLNNKNNLNEENLQQFKNDKIIKSNEQTSVYSKRSYKLHPIQQKTSRDNIQKEKIGDSISQKSTAYKEQILKLINQLNDNQLEKLKDDLQKIEGEQELNENEQQDLLKIIDNNQQNNENKDNTIQVDNNEKNQQEQQMQNEDIDMKSISQFQGQKSIGTYKTSKTFIYSLEKQLKDEKQARIKLKEEIDELKKMNGELCNAILSNSQQKKK